MSNSKTTSHFKNTDMLLATGGFLSTLSFLTLLYFMLFRNVGPAQPYYLIYTLILGFNCALLLPSSMSLARKRSSHRLLKYGVMLSTLLILMALVLMGYGFLQDATKIVCYDFLGWNHVGCLASMWLRVFIVFFNPLVFIPAGLFVGMLLGVGLYRQYSGLKLSKRRRWFFESW